MLGVRSLGVEGAEGKMRVRRKGMGLPEGKAGADRIDSCDFNISGYRNTSGHGSGATYIYR